ncbi:hypothetical protein [Sphingomonas daechungensis]|uniref:hypothetical protein n=1 Tax=Sphingomonas daechungensis TaxID=1176646 RepID=UPI0037841917
MKGPNDADASDQVQRRQDIHRLLSAIVGPVQFVSMVPRGTGDGPIRAEIFDAVDLPAAVAWVARNDAEGRASYYSLSVVRDGLRKKATKSDIVAARGLFVDIDPPKDGEAFDKAWHLDRLYGLEVPPSFIVDSGNGLQPVWLFDQPEHDLARVEGVNRGLAEKLAGDHCFNIDRILRVPGSLNTPDAKKAAAGRVPVRARFIT